MMNKQVVQDFLDARARVRCELKALDGLINVESHLTPEDINYGHVGDLEYVEQKLEEVLNFLTRQSWDSESEV
jgi:hypothetical protein